jgi:hypothetical protein
MTKAPMVTVKTMVRADIHERCLILISLRIPRLNRLILWFNELNEMAS